MCGPVKGLKERANHLVVLAKGQREIGALEGSRLAAWGVGGLGDPSKDTGYPHIHV